MATDMKEKKDYFTHLAEELLLEIGSYLDLKGRLKLRVVLPKARQGVVADMLKEVRTVLHVAPSTVSLRHFVNICMSEFFRHHITHLVFVPAVLDTGDHFDKSSPTFEEYCESWAVKKMELSKNDALRSFEIYSVMAHEHVSQVPLPDVEYTGYDTGDTLSPSTNLILQYGMRQLPRLSAVSVSSASNLEGLNVSTMFLGDHATAERLSKDHLSVRHDQAGLTACYYFPKKAAGIDTLFAAIAELPADINISSLALGTSMSDQLAAGIQSHTIFDRHHLKSLFRHLTSLTVGCADFEDDDLEIGERAPTWKRVAKYATNLEHLKLFTGAALADCFWRSPEQGAKVLDHFLDLGKYLKLRSLHVEGNHDKPGVVNPTKLQRFLTNHIASLRNIILKDVLLVDMARGQEVCSDIRAVLEKVRSAASSLESFKMTLNRREHSGDPCDEDDESCVCERYLVGNRKWVHRTVFDDLANDLGVSLGGEGWEFGEYVMRP